MDDGALINIRRHGNPEGPRIVLSHGWNPVSDLQAYHFWTFVNDNTTILQAIDRHFGRKPKIGVFHSMSALIAILQEQKDSIFSAFILFDPPLKLPWGTFEDMANMEFKMSAATLKRQHRFKSPEEFARKLQGQSAFRRMQDSVTDLFTRTVLRPAADGTGYELCCPVEHEARIWEYFSSWVEYSELENLACLVKVIGGDPTDQYSFIPSRNLNGIIHVDYDFIPETTHLLMLEKPEECVALTLEFLESLEINP